MLLTRRLFLQASTLACAAKAFSLPSTLSLPQVPESDSQALNEWEFYSGPLDPSFQIWHSAELVTWDKVTLPHCVNRYDACDPDVPAYRGQSWYRTTLQVANPYPTGRTLLHFEGAGQSAQVYLGEKLVGSHEGGYDEFVIDITEAIGSQAKPKLAVLCDNGRDLDRMPSDLSDFTLYGGLYRAVHLVYVPAVSLEAVHTDVRWQMGEDAAVSVTGRLFAPYALDGSVTVNVTVSEPGGEVIRKATKIFPALWTGEVELDHFSIPAPKTWSPSQPSLYQCEVLLTHSGQAHVVAHRFGVLHTRWEEHGPFYLNGERLALRGTHRHEDHAGYAAAMPDSLIREELQMIKDMGVNFIRLAHYQQSRLVLELCDALGILVWEEVPWCRSGVVNQKFEDYGKSKLAIMIDQHRNHASVLLWGLGNEDDWPGEPKGDNHEATRAYMAELRDLSHKLDPTRMTSFRRCDFAMDIPDVYSPSIWAGWYSGSYTEYRSALEKARPTVKHLFHAEWGADSHAGRHAEDPDSAMIQVATGGSTAEKGFDYKLTGGSSRMAKDGEWSETYACDLMDWHLKTLEEVPWLTGAAQWVFKDFTTPLRVDNPVPRVNQKGVVTRDLQPKESYYVFQSYWSPNPMVHIYGHSWPVRWGKAGQKRTVRVYSNCNRVELFLNGQSLGEKQRDPQDFPCAGLRWDAAFVAGHNELHAVAHTEHGSFSDTVSFYYETRAWGAPAALALHRIERKGNRSSFLAELLDANGVRCLNSRAVVRFSLAGEGRLIDNLGTPTGSRVVQLCNGQASISVEHVKQIELSVASPEVEPAFCCLSSQVG